MLQQPSLRRTIVFVDAQNLYGAARTAFGRQLPDYDPVALAELLCKREHWQLAQVRFYAGVPVREIDPYWYAVWARKVEGLEQRGVWTYSRQLRYRKQKAARYAASPTREVVGLENRIVLRLALDMVQLAHDDAFDVALVLSQDEVLSEVAEEVGAIAEANKRWKKVACAFPVGDAANHIRGIAKTAWLKIDPAMYEACVEGDTGRQQVA